MNATFVVGELLIFIAGLAQVTDQSLSSLHNTDKNLQAAINSYAYACCDLHIWPQN